MTATSDQSTARPATCMQVEPGVCGFTCRIQACLVAKRTVSVSLQDSECRQIQNLAAKLEPVDVRALFTPLTRNPIYKAAEQSGCHASCVIPGAILKTAEVALEMALPREVRMVFEPCEEGCREAQ